MPIIIKIKRRGVGDGGPPTSLRSGEVAFNENNEVLYYGKGDLGNGFASEIIAIGGTGAVNNNYLIIDTPLQQTVLGPVYFAGITTAVTQPLTDSSTKLATTEFVQNLFGSVVGGIGATGVTGATGATGVTGQLARRARQGLLAPLVLLVT